MHTDGDRTCPVSPGRPLQRFAFELESKLTISPFRKRVHVAITIRVAILVFALIANLSGSSALGDDAANAPSSLDSVSVDVQNGTNVTQSGVHIICTPKDGLASLQLVSAHAAVTVTVERAVTVYLSKPRPRIVVVHERYASDEDRLIVFDLTRRDPRRATITHTDPGDYVHVHFRIDGLRDGRVLGEEYEYAGSKEPRKRSISIRPGPKGFEIERGRWTEDE
jgi:hypothetical protein